MTLIGFYSYGRRAGKDTAAGMVADWCAERGLSCQRVAFADRGKLLVAEALGLRGATDAETIAAVDEFKLHGAINLYPDLDHCVLGISGRDFIINLLGELGVDGDSGARRVLGRGVWTDAALPADWTPRADVTCVTDVRAEDEVERIRSLGGTMVEVVNPRSEFQGGRSEKGLNLGLDSWVLDNSRGLDHLRAGVDYMARMLSDPDRVLHRRAHG